MWKRQVWPTIIQFSQNHSKNTCGIHVGYSQWTSFLLKYNSGKKVSISNINLFYSVESQNEFHLHVACAIIIIKKKRAKFCQSYITGLAWIVVSK